MIKSVEFDQKNIKIEDVITFKEGLPGLEHLKKFILAEPERDLPFKYLQSVEDKDIALVVIDPYLYLEEYSFDVYEDVIDDLKIKDASDILVLSVVVIPSNIENMTANLAAPIIINVNNREGKQIILQNSNYEIRYPIAERYKNLIGLGVV